MWESPSWMGSLLSAKVKKESDEAARALTATVEANKLQMQENLENLRLQTQRDIAAENRQADIDIANARISADKSIAEERNKVNKQIAMWQTVGNVAPKILPIALGAKVISKSDDNNSTLNTGGPKASVGTEVASKEEIRKKADELFPNLEPTFELKPLDSKVTKFGINTAMVGAATALLTSIPLLGL